MRETRTRIPEHNLDVLRAIAVLAVLVDHAVSYVGHDSGFTNWLGQAGVQAFFVHTSLVLMASLERDGAPSKDGWVRRFYLRRALRIYPLAWVVIALVLILHVPRVPRADHGLPFQPVSISTLSANLALMQNVAGQSTVLAPLWTLPLELQMYLALPLCFLVARRPSREWTTGLLAIGVAGAAFFSWGTSSAHLVPGLWRFDVLEYVPCFLMGVLAYASLRRSGTGPALSATAWIPLIVLDILLLYLGWRVLPNWWGIRALFCAFLGIALPLVRDARPSVVTRAAHTIATYSYGIYLIHLLALWIGFSVLHDQPPLVKGIAATLALVLGCLAAYHGVEKPAIDFGRRLLEQRSGAASLEASAPAP